MLLGSLLTNWDFFFFFFFFVLLYIIVYKNFNLFFLKKKSIPNAIVMTPRSNLRSDRIIPFFNTEAFQTIVETRLLLP